MFKPRALEWTPHLAGILIGIVLKLQISVVKIAIIIILGLPSTNMLHFSIRLNIL